MVCRWVFVWSCFLFLIISSPGFLVPLPLESKLLFHITHCFVLCPQSLRERVMKVVCLFEAYLFIYLFIQNYFFIEFFFFSETGCLWVEPRDGFSRAPPGGDKLSLQRSAPVGVKGYGFACGQPASLREGRAVERLRPGDGVAF